MRTTLLSISFLILCFSLWGQIDNDWIKNNNLTDTVKLDFKVSMADNSLALIKYNSAKNSPFLTQVIGLDLDESNLKFTALPYQGEGAKSDLKILGIRRYSESELEPFHEETIDLQFSKSKKEGVSYTILDVTEDFLDFGEKYTLEIERAFYTDFNPDIPLQKMGFIWDAGPMVMAAGGLLWANSLKNQRQKAMENYLSLWGEGVMKSVAQDFDKTAKKKKREALYVLGGSLIGAAIFEGVIWYFRTKRNKRIKLQQQINPQLF